MASFKGFYISAFIGFMLGMISYSIYQYSLDTTAWIWLANSLSYATGIAYFIGIYIIATPRTSKNMLTTWGPILLGTILVLVATFSKSYGYTPVLLNIAMVIGWYLYTYWATDFSDRDKNLLQVGKAMPNVELKDADGNIVSLNSFFNAPAVFLFYRGNWCPFCMAQIKELSKEYQKIKDKGAALVFVSPQSPKHTKHLAKKFDIPAHFLIDQDLKAATELQLFHKNGTPTGMEVLGFDSDNILPTLIVTDSKGIIRFADLTDNYRLRPEPSVYLELLEGL